MAHSRNLILNSVLIVAILTTVPVGSSSFASTRDLQPINLFPPSTVSPSSLIQANQAEEAYFVFDCPTHPETFVFKLTDPVKIQQARNILNGTARGIVVGAIIRQPVYYNPPWHFYLDPKSISFAEAAVEVCDSNIRGIEDNLDSAYPTWCPWNTRLLREIPPPAKPGIGNLSPAISMMQPYINNLPKLTAPATIQLKAAADDPDGTISKVEFFEGNNKLGEDTSYPYSITWSYVLAGSYLLSAKVIDNEGATASSKSIIFTVDASTSNPIDQTDFFVYQHYRDFLNREPEEPFFSDWQNILNNCPVGSTACDRVEVSSAFFRSPEFRERGYFTYRFYAVSLGRKPDFAEFMPDMARVSGFLTEAEKEQAKQAFVAEFMTRPQFANIYDGLSNNDYVQRLFDTAGVTQVTVSGAVHTAATMQQAMAVGKSRAQVLREIVESPEIDAKFYTQAFVVMQYFGYLRRDPDSLYLDWIETMNSNPSNYRQMVHGFVNSIEYRSRFVP